MLKIALIDKSLNNTNYSKHFGFPIDVYHMSSEKVSGRLLKADIDLGTPSNPFNRNDYDFIILVGAEAAKLYGGRTGLMDYTGKRVSNNGYDNYLLSISPAMLHFKPELKPTFERTVEDITRTIEGNERKKHPTNYKPISTEDDAYEYLLLVEASSNTISFDCETTGLYPRNCYVLGLSITHKKYQGVYIEADVITDKISKVIQRIIDNPKNDIIYHNAKFDISQYKYHLNIDFQKAFDENRLHDTMLLHYALDERKGTHGLKQLAMKFTDMGDYDYELDLFKTEYCSKHKIKKEDFTYDLIPFDIMWKYAAADTDATFRLFELFWPKVRDNAKLYDMYTNILMKGTNFLQRMEDRGVPVSIERLEASGKYLNRKLEEDIKKLYEFEVVTQYEKDRGDKFNPNSVKQLRELLFDYLKLIPTGKLTGTGELSTDAEVLEKLASQHPIARVILSIRKGKKLLSTYVEKMLESIDLDGRIRTNFNLQTTTSGRLSSSGKINLQQLPRDESLIKACIVAPAGYVVVAHDLVTAEVYYAAVLSNDKNMQQVFINMQKEPDKYPDFHSNIAHMVFNLLCEPREVKKLFPALRQAAKAITFGILYGSGADKVAHSVNEALMEEYVKAVNIAEENGTALPEYPSLCTKMDANGYIETYFSKFPKVKKWIEEKHKFIKNNGYVYSHFGRKRRLHNINSADRGIVGEELRSGLNALVQGVSSDTLLLGAIDADEEIRLRGLEADIQIIMLVHDSVVSIVREDLVKFYEELIVRNIQKDRGVSIPGYPIGVSSDSEVNGSVDYSCGKIKKQHPLIATINDPRWEEGMLNKLKDLEFNGKDPNDEIAQDILREAKYYIPPKLDPFIHISY